MTYNAIITHIESVMPIDGRDRIQLANILGYQVIVSVDTKPGDRVIFFPGGDGALNKEYATQNNLLKSLGGYIEDKNRRVRAIRMASYRSDGLAMPLSSLSYIKGLDYNKLEDGKELTSVTTGFFRKKHDICYRYLTEAARRQLRRQKRKASSRRSQTVYFRKFPDVEQLRHYIDKIPHGANITLTTKIHGCAGRSGIVPDIYTMSPIRKILGKIIPFFAPKKIKKKMVGSRNVVITDNVYRNSYYGTDQFRFDIADRLPKVDGFVYYYEIVGWYGPEETNTIMPSVNVKDTKELKKYGNKNGRMVYSYGLKPGECDFYVYNIARVSDDGTSVNLEWNELVDHCSEHNIKYVPYIEQFIYDGDKEGLKLKIDHMVNGESGMECFPSRLCKDHIEEGIVLRIDHLGGKYWLKAKNAIFLYGEQQTKDEDVVDMEEIS